METWDLAELPSVDAVLYWVVTGFISRLDLHYTVQ